MRISNLLPRQEQKMYGLYVSVLYARRFLLALSVVLALGLALFAAEMAYYQAKLSSLREAATTLRDGNAKFNVEGLQETANKQNAQVKAAAAVLKARPSLSILLDELVRILPEGVTLDSVKIETAPPRIDVKGRAATREQIVALQNRLQASEVLRSTYAPLSNLTESQNASFYFILSFDLKDVTGTK